MALLWICLFALIKLGTGSPRSLYDLNGAPNFPDYIEPPPSWNSHELTIFRYHLCPLNLNPEPPGLVNNRLNAYIERARTKIHQFPVFFVENVTSSAKTKVGEKISEMLENAKTVDPDVLVITQFYHAFTIESYYLVLDTCRGWAEVPYNAEEIIQSCEDPDNCVMKDFFGDVEKIYELTDLVLTKLEKMDWKTLHDVGSICRGAIFNKIMFDDIPDSYVEELRTTYELRHYLFNVLKGLAEFTQLKLGQEKSNIVEY